MPQSFEHVYEDMERLKRRTGTLILWMLMLSALWVLINMFIQSSFVKNRSQFRSISTEYPENYRWVKPAESGAVYRIALEISGESPTDLEALIGENEAEMVHRVMLKKGTIDYAYAHDWFSDVCFLRVTPKHPRKGSLEVAFRFFTEN